MSIKLLICEEVLFNIVLLPVLFSCAYTYIIVFTVIKCNTENDRGACTGRPSL